MMSRLHESFFSKFHFVIFLQEAQRLGRILRAKKGRLCFVSWPKLKVVADLQWTPIPSSCNKQNPLYSNYYTIQTWLLLSFNSLVTLTFAPLTNLLLQSWVNSIKYFEVHPNIAGLSGMLSR